MEKTKLVHIKVNTIDIYNNPKNYTDSPVMLEGISCGWGLPKHSKVIWGKMKTKSDWVFEDSTGAIYVSGGPKLDEGANVVITGNVVFDNDKDWWFNAENELPK